jgi:hypothetical protein
MNEVYDVRARIRYGRRSAGRDDTYTMVFSEQAAEGRAKVVRCRCDVSTPADLFIEAEYLWAAERNVAPNGSLASDWGCVALLCNPDRTTAQDLASGWVRRVSAEPGYCNIPHASGERAPVSAEGLLQISWPVMAGSSEPVPLDLLIATANHPTLVGDSRSYPTPKMIATEWRTRKAVENNRVEYFQKNVDHGIRTFEDDAIAESL